MNESAVTSPPALELRRASKAFGHVVALSNASVAAYRREVLAIVGDNGAGKSTLIKVLAGVHRMDSGEYVLGGKPTSFSGPSDARDAGVATVFQDLALVECLDIAANMYLGRPLTRARVLVDRKSMHASAAATLQGLKVRLPSVRVPVGVLSGGQRQGVAIARAILQESDVILMDEPTAALGVRETQQVADIIDGLRNRNKAVIIVSHDLEQVFALSDRIVVMRLGRTYGVRNTRMTDRSEIIALITGIVSADHDIEMSPS